MISPTGRRTRHRGGTLVVALATATALLGGAPAAVATIDTTPAGESVPTGGVTTSPTGRYFVTVASEETDHAALPEGTSVQALPAPDEAVAQLVEDVDASPVAEDVTVTATHEELWTGAVVEADAQAVGVIAELPGVVSVYPVLPVTLAAPAAAETAETAGSTDTAETTGATETTALPAAGVAAAEGTTDAGTTPQAVDPGAGKGTRIAIIDSGIDLDHPAFGGRSMNNATPFPNNVVVGGHDYVEGDARPDDTCNGHGTHVAGIAAGRPVASDASVNRDSPIGVAPAAQLLVYRVFGCDPSVPVGADTIIDAMERAWRDGADVVNISATIVGMSWSDYPTAVAGGGLVSNGVTVVAAQGNSSTFPPSLFAVGAPAVGEGVIAVGASSRGAVASFSQWGPSAELEMRPDVLAPGDGVLSAYPLELADKRGLWRNKSGTSMATPAVAGLAAVLTQRYPGIAPEAVAARVVGTAMPTRNGFGVADPLAKQGGGIINHARATSTRLLASPSRLDLREAGPGGPRTMRVVLQDGAATTYEVRHDAAAALQTNSGGGTPAAPVESSDPTFAAGVQIAGSGTTVTTSASRTTNLDITITPPGGKPAGVLYSGYVTLLGPNGQVALRIPYLGMTGDYSALPFHTAATPAGPELRTITGCTTVQDGVCASGLQSTRVSDNSEVYTLAGHDVPLLMFSLAYPAQDVSIDVLRVTDSGATGRLSGRARPLVEPKPSGSALRDNAADEFYWDGTYSREGTNAPQDAPNGTYQLRFTATKPLASRPPAKGDTTTWNSPRFSIRAGQPAWYLSTNFGSIADRQVDYGAPSDTDVYVGDWDGDGVDGIAYRRGNTFYARNNPTSGVFDIEVDYGRPDDTVYVGDWDGDGKDTFAVRRGNRFFFANDFRGGQAAWYTDYGKVDDEVVIGNWAGGAVDYPAVRRGNRYYFAHDFRGGKAAVEQAYGRADDVVLPGDFDGDGTDTLAVRRHTTNYVKNDFAGGNADITVTFGRADDTPLVGTWTKGAHDTFGLHRPQR